MAKVLRLLVRGFFSWDFYDPKAGMDFPMDSRRFECVSSMFSVKFLLILNFTNAVIKDYLQKNFCIIKWCVVGQRNL